MATLTPMQRHQLRTQAAAGEQAATLDGNQRALRWLHTQRGLLAALQSRQAREAHKAKVLPEIEPYLQTALAADSGAPDPVLQYATVWAMDAGAWPLAINLTAYAMRHGLAMPDEFKRSAPTLLCDLLADAILTGQPTQGDGPALMQQALTLTAEADMPDQTRAKSHKAIAYGLAGKTTLAGQAGSLAGLAPNVLAMALDHLQRAEQLDPKTGVKKDIAAVQKLLQKAEQPDTTTAEAESKTPGRAPGAGGAKTTPKPAAKKAAPRKTTAKKTT